MMDRAQLRYFLAIVDAGNFSRAAARVNVAQPTLSVAIAKLEARLGTRLFVRSSQRVQLTEAGSRLLDQARLIEAQFHEAERLVAARAPVRTLRLGILSTLATGLTEAMLAARTMPEPIELVEGTERDLAARLERGRIDAAITVLRSGGRFDREPLFMEDYRLAMPASHRLAGQNAVAAEALASETMILRRGCEALAETSRHFTLRGIRPPFSFKTQSDDRALAMIRQGIGITVMPAGLPIAGISRPMLAGFDLRRQIGLVFSEQLPAAARDISATLAAARSVLGRHQAAQ
ncbi:LysR family transcriptional regulator [Sphingomonas sp. 1P06PA]|uniref:LysR family transcriptional regulator n=1 Tax=Sphingomonas sp. 1P06PA TaxID=554121 RepID=UPI0039A48E0A